MKPLRIFTPVWGEEHIHRFESGLLKSMLWPQNREILADNIRYWHLFTTIESMPKLEALMTKTGYPFQLHGIDPIAMQGDGPRAQAILNGGTEIMSACLVDKSIFMTAFTDIVFADGSIEPMLALAQRPRVAVTVPHMRVLPEFLNALDRPRSCAQMVTIAMKYAHVSWRDAEIGIKGMFRSFSNQYMGGLSWEKIGNYYLIQHVIPNVWMANIEQSDIDFLKNAAFWGAYDHNWPGKLLDEDRNRVIGSSDASFMVELTEYDKGISPNTQIDMNQPDAFHHDGLEGRDFHRRYRAHVSVFREG